MGLSFWDLLFYHCKCTESWARKRETVPVHVTRHLPPTAHRPGMLQGLGKAHQSCSFPRRVLVEQKLRAHCQQWRKKRRIFSLLKSVSVQRFESWSGGFFVLPVPSLSPQTVSQMPEISSWVFLLLDTQTTFPAKLQDAAPEDENCLSHSCPYLWEGKTWVRLHHWKALCCCLYVENSHIRNIKKEIKKVTHQQY